MKCLAFHLISYRFSPFNCCLNVVLSLDKGDYPENLQAVFCPDKSRSFEPLMCLDLTVPFSCSITLYRPEIILACWLVPLREIVFHSVFAVPSLKRCLNRP